MILFFLKEIFQTPAPGTYYPEKVHPPNEQSAPAFSMGARTRVCTSKYDVLLTQWLYITSVNSCSYSISQLVHSTKYARAEGSQ